LPYYLTKHTVSTESKGRKVPIYLSRPTVPDRRPVVVIVHEWWGLNDQIKGVADRYANLGYVAAAPDLFGGEAVKDMEEAKKRSGSMSVELSSQIINSVLDYLSIREFVNQSKIGVQGFCFGGTHTFNFACESKRIAATAIFYAGRIPPQEKLANIASPLFVVYGDKDQAVKPDQVRELEATLKKLGKNAQVELFPGAQHAFCNEKGPNYNKEAAESAWEKVTKFYATYLPLPKTKEN
jgi:carboxymethylenebutenolidase